MLAEGESIIRNPLYCDDTLRSMDAAALMGSVVSRGRTLRIRPSLRQAPDVINAGNSGTTARLLSSVCALLPGHAVITGDASLRTRPMEPVIRAVRQLGGRAFSTLGSGTLPAVFGGVMHRGYATLQADLSSQFASSLAISCPLKEGDTEIRLKGRVQSPSYLRLTVETAALFGCRSVFEEGTIYCAGGSSYHGRDFTVTGDFSSAAFILSAAAVTGGSVTVRGLKGSGAQADASIAGMLASFGCSTRVRGGSVTVHAEELSGADIDCTASPDLFPVVCAVAAAARGRSRIHGSRALRFKESDRIEATLAMLHSLGVRAAADGDDLVIEGGRIVGGRVESMGDHRIAMAACVAGLSSKKGCTISDGESHSVSYPSFIRDICSIGAEVTLA